MLQQMLFQGHCISLDPLNKEIRYLFFFFFFFFLIGNIRTIINEIRKKHTGCSLWWTQKSINSRQKQRNQEPSLIEEKNSRREEQSVKPQYRDQSNSLRWHKSFNSTNVFSKSSKKLRLCSNQIVHIKQPRIKFQIHNISPDISHYVRLP